MGHHHHKINRRTFLGQASCAAVGMSTLFNTVLNLKSMNAASAFNLHNLAGPFDDYKAVVCILLSGGCDSYNMLVPTSTADYDEYATTRSNQAIPKEDLIPINPTNTSGKEFGLHPNMPNMASIFESGNLAFVSNIGSLIEPTDKNAVYNGTSQLPLGLFSHADQIAHWQTAIPQDRVAAGWGGKIADMLNDLPNGPTSNPNISMNVSLSGSNVFQTGINTNQYSIDRNNGATGLYGYSEDWLQSQLRKEVVDNMVDATYQDIFKKTYMKTVKTARDGGAQFIEALNNATPLTTEFESCIVDQRYNCLSTAMEMVAKTINVREALGMKRQIFFVEYGGWDHHEELLNSQAGMMNEVDMALGAFNNAVTEMGLQDQVTTFSISEFSRTLTSNGNGTDHAWGGNMFVMGGAVSGQKIYGQYPQLALGSNLEIGNGVILPTTSADEYFAELAMWYNVPKSGLLDIFPNLGNFYSVTSPDSPIGFMNM